MKLTARQRKALKGSIKKWQAIVNGTGEDRGIGNCPLCVEYFENKDCSGCPVAKVIGQSNCEGTPYPIWDSFGFEKLSQAKAAGCYEDARKAAVAELNFLKAMLA